MDQQTVQVPNTKYWEKGLKGGFVVLIAALVLFTGFFVISHYTGHAQCQGAYDCPLLLDLSTSFGLSLVFLWSWFVPAVLLIPLLVGLIIDGVKNFRIK